MPANAPYTPASPPHHSPCEACKDTTCFLPWAWEPKETDEEKKRHEETEKERLNRQIGEAMQRLMHPAAPPTKRAEQQRKRAIDTLGGCADIMRKRSHDYASDNDAFSNFRFTGMILDLAIEAGCRGADLSFIALLSTKMARMIELRGSGKAPSSERILDTVQDIANYAALWESCIHDEAHGVGMAKDQNTKG